MPYPYYTYNNNDFDIYYDNEEGYIYKNTYDNTGNYLPFNTWNDNTTTIPTTISTYPVSMPTIPNPNQNYYWQNQYTTQPYTGINSFYWDCYNEEGGKIFIETCPSIYPEDKIKLLTHKFIGGMKTTSQLNPAEYLFTAVCKECQCSFQVSTNNYTQPIYHTQQPAPFKNYGIYYIGNSEVSKILNDKEIDFLTLSCEEYAKIIKKYENLLVLK